MPGHGRLAPPDLGARPPSAAGGLLLPIFPSTPRGGVRPGAASRATGARIAQTGAVPSKAAWVLDGESELERSLRIKNDPRFLEMRQSGGVAHHYERLAHGNLSAISTPWAKNDDREVVENDGTEAVDLDMGPSSVPYGGIVSDDGAWRETFDRSVRRLMVDFDLSDAPNCKLNHLERMHAWFENHKQKPPPKADDTPNFLTADRRGGAPVGSMRNVPKQMSTTTEMLAPSYTKRRTRAMSEKCE